MRILAIADEPDQRLWGDRCRELLKDVDLILSAGDLSPDRVGLIHGERVERPVEKGHLFVIADVVEVDAVRLDFGVVAVPGIGDRQFQPSLERGGGRFEVGGHAEILRKAVVVADRLEHAGARVDRKGAAPRGYL